MFFVSSSPNYRAYIRSEIPELRNQAGDLVQPGKQAIRAQFEAGGSTPDWMQERVLKELSFRGLADEQHPLQRISFFDTVHAATSQGWTEQERVLVERKLLDACGDGTVIMVEKPLAPLPYPKYLDHRRVQGRRTIQHVLEDVKAALEATGVAPSAVIAYEIDHHDNISDEIVAAMKELAVGDLDEEIVAA